MLLNIPKNFVNKEALYIQNTVIVASLPIFWPFFEEKIKKI